MIDGMGNYIPPQSGPTGGGILETGQIFLFNNMPLNYATNILFTGGLSMYAQSGPLGRTDKMVGGVFGASLRGTAKRSEFKKYARMSADAKRGGGLATFLLPDNLGGQNLERQMFADAGILKQRSFMNPMRHLQSATADFSSRWSALSSGKELEWLKVADRAKWDSLEKTGTGRLASRKIANTAVKAGIWKAGLGAVANVASRALAFQETMLLGQVGNVFIPGGDFGGIFQSLGHEEAQRQRAGRTLATMSYGFHDNGGAATMRQRSLNAIHNSQSRLQQVFGNEAMFSHR